MVTLLLHLLRLLPMLCGGHRQVALENLALRHQLAVYKKMVNRPKLLSSDRLFWVALSRVWAGWRQALVIVSPNTVLRWQRRRFREYWARIESMANCRSWESTSLSAPSPACSRSVAHRRRRRGAHFWPITSGTSSPSISSRFPPRACAYCSSSSCSPTTAGASSTSLSPSIPTAAWTAQQIVDAFPDDSAPSYLLRDRDSVYGHVFRPPVQPI